MKRIIYSLPLAAVLLFTGCEKENPGRGLKKKPGSPVATEKTVPQVNVTVGNSCGGRICNGQEVSNQMYNLLTMTKVSGPTPLVYSLYERTFNIGGIEVYTRYAQYSCSQSPTQYAGGLVNNNTAGLVCSTDPSTPTLPPVTIVLVNGIMSTPPADTDFDFVTIGAYEGAAGCGDPNG